MASTPTDRMTPMERRAGVSLASIFALRMLGLFLILPVFSVYAKTLPGGGDLTMVGIALGAYGLTQAIFQIPFGIASDLWGRKRVIAAGLVLFAFGSFVAAAAPDIGWIIVGRVIQGAGAISAAVTALLKARRIYLVGAGVSHHIAGFLQDGLAIYLDAGVIFVGSRGGPETAVPLLMPAGPKDLVVAISMPRYSQMTLDLARFAKRRGAPVLGLTDAPSSPLAALSDITLFTPARNRLMPNSPTAAFALVDALITTIARERPNAVEALKELSDSLIWTFHR